MSDLIDRNAVMLRVREFIGNPTYNENMLVNDLNALPSAEPEQKCAKDARCSEQAAKILNRSEGFYSAHGVCICGHCEHCGNAVCDDFRFCPYCGTTLDWSDDE